MSDERPRAPVRPALPPLLWATAGLWSGIILAEGWHWRAWTSGEASVGLGTTALVAAALCVAFALRRRVPGGAALLVGLAGGAVVGTLFWTGWQARVDGLENPRNARLEVEVLADATTSRFGARSPIRVIAAGGALEGARLDCSWPTDGSPPELGFLARVMGTVRPCDASDRGRLLHQRGTVGSLRARIVRGARPARTARGVVARTRVAARRAIDTVAGPGGDLMAGVVLGDRRRLQGTAADADFRTCGLSHLVAVSGSHLVVVAATVMGLARLARAGPRVSATVMLGVLGLYVIATGVQASAVRAWLMTCVLVFARGSRRRGDGLAALAAAAACALAHSPPVAFDLGFRLSVAAVGGLIAFGALAERWTAAALPARASALAGPLSMTLVAQAATVPLTVAAFGTVSTVAPVANLVAAPLITALLVTGLLGTALRVAEVPGAATLLGVAGAAGNAAAEVAGRLAALPSAAVLVPASGALWVGTLAGMAALWVWWPAPVRARAGQLGVAALVALLLLAVGPPGPAGPRIVVLDVGQGDAILVRDGPHALLVDAGPSASALRTALARAGVRRLDAVLVTHLHDDHYGGLEALEGTVAVGRVLLARGALREPTAASAAAQAIGAACVETGRGEVLSVGDARVEVVWPAERVSDAAENEASVVARVSVGDSTLLLTGDAEGEVLDRLVHDGALGAVDAVKVGHHGSAGSLTEGALDVLSPGLAIVSVGQGNRFGHPHPETLGMLRSRGITTLRTDLEGDITLQPSANGWRVDVDGRNRHADSAARGAADRVAVRNWHERHAAIHGRFEEGRDGQGRGPQTGLPDPRVARAAPHAGSRAPPCVGRRGRRPRFQPGLLRRGDSRRRCGHRRLQHPAVRLRASPRDRA